MGYYLNDGKHGRRENGNQSSKDIYLVPGGLVKSLHHMFLEMGIRSERRGERHAALELYKNAVATNPESALAWYNYGDILLALEKYDESVDALQKAVALDPDVPLYHYDLGLAFYKLKRYEEAIKELEPIVKSDPQLKRASSTLGLSAMFNLALSENLCNKPDCAIETLLPAKGTALNVIYNLALFYLNAHKWNDAVQLFKALSIVNTQEETYIHGLGYAYLKLKKDADASACLQRAVKLDPSCQSAWYDLGVVLARMKKRIEARRCFRKARDLNPKDPWPYYDLACLDALAGKTELAFRWLKKSVDNGFANVRHLRRDSDLRSLHSDERWKILVSSIAGQQKTP